MKSRLGAGFILVLCVGMLVSPVYGVDAEFNVTDKVAAEAPPRIGINLGHSVFYPWKHPSFNLWVQGAALNGQIIRNKYVIGGDKGEYRMESGANYVAQDRGLGYWDAFRTGFWNDADYVVYRYGDAERAEVVRQGKIKEFINPGIDRDNPDSGLIQRFVFDESGPELKTGDELVVSMTHYNFDSLDELRVKDGATFEWGKTSYLLEGGTFSYDREQISPLAGSEASLRIVSKAGFNLEQHYAGTLKDYWPKLPEGKTFTFNAWMKYEGDGSGRVDIDVAGIGGHRVDLDDEWKQVTFSFASAVPEKIVDELVISSSDSGVFWLDGVTVHRSDAPLGGYFPEQIEALKKYNPGILRIWSFQTNGSHGNTLDNAIRTVDVKRSQYKRNKGAVVDHAPALADDLALCEEVGADPWLICNVAFNQDEWANLIEYLAGPTNSPYGRLRALNGHPEPYTQSFETIYLEMGNEIWSTLFRPWTWNNRPQIAAKYARLMWEAAADSPYFDEQIFKFVGPGWANNIANRGEKSYGSRFSSINTMNAYQEAAHYNGGFDGVQLAEAGGRREQLINRLFYSPRIIEPMIDTHVSAMASIREDLRGASYEGGPGYELPGPGKVYTEEQEAVGKSLASAITTMDAYMYMQKNRFGPLCYFLFGNGTYNWQSHRKDWQPHAVTIALSMRNRYCTGDLMEVETLQVPTVNIPQATIAKSGHGGSKKEKILPAVSNCPTVLCYAFKDGKEHSILLISREPETAREVSVKLPDSATGEWVVHQLSHDDPWATNRDEMMLKEKQTVVTAQGRKIAVTLPPHSLSILTKK